MDQAISVGDFVADLKAVRTNGLIFRSLAEPNGSHGFGLIGLSQVYCGIIRCFLHPASDQNLIDVCLDLVGEFGVIARKSLYIDGFTASVGGIPLRDQA